MAGNKGEGGGFWGKVFGVIGAASVAAAPVPEVAAQTQDRRGASLEAELGATERADAVPMRFLHENPYRGSKTEALSILQRAPGVSARFTPGFMTRAQAVLNAPSNFRSYDITGLDPQQLNAREGFDAMTQGLVGGESGAGSLVRQGRRISLNLAPSVTRDGAGGDDLADRIGAERWIVPTDNPNEIAIFTLLEVCDNIAVRFATLRPIPTVEAPQGPREAPADCATITTEGLGDRGVFVVGVVAPGDASAAATQADVCWPDVVPSELLCVGQSCDPERAAFEVLRANMGQLGIRDVPGPDVQMNTYGALVRGRNGEISVPRLGPGKRGWVVICPAPTPQERAAGISFVPALVRWEALQDGSHNLSIRDWPRLQNGRPLQQRR